MGTLRLAKCLDCEKEFEYSEGGGFQFAIINCNTCSKATSISWKEKEEKSFHGYCECGGSFINSAKPRCLHCNSLNIKDIETKLYFD